MRLCQLSRSNKILEVAQILIAKGINVNETDKKGMNALMLLCSRLSKSNKILEVAQLLIAKGININQTDKKGRNALMCWRSESDKKLEVAKLLIDKGIDINQTSTDGLHALSIFMLHRHRLPRNDKITEMTRFLLSQIQLLILIERRNKGC